MVCAEIKIGARLGASRGSVTVGRSFLASPDASFSPGRQTADRTWARCRGRVGKNSPARLTDVAERRRTRGRGRERATHDEIPHDQARRNRAVVSGGRGADGSDALAATDSPTTQAGSPAPSSTSTAASWRDATKARHARAPGAQPLGAWATSHLWRGRKCRP
jgi:hypothetical protein